jgi:leucyl aminopeptidase
MASANKRAEVVNLDDNPNIRPIGHKKAKDERYGKRKTLEAYSAVSEKLYKFIELTTMFIKDHDKMSEKKQQLAYSKVEAARLNDQAAEKQLKCKMLDTYRELLVAPTTSMNAAALAEREKALECMRLTLFLKIIKVFCKY